MAVFLSSLSPSDPLPLSVSPESTAATAAAFSEVSTSVEEEWSSVFGKTLELCEEISIGSGLEEVCVSPECKCVINFNSKHCCYL